MHIRQHVAAAGLVQEGNHRNHDQQRFQAFAHQDREGGQETGGAGRLAGAQNLFGFPEQAVERRHLAAHGFHRLAVGDAGTHRNHGVFDAQHQRIVARRQHRFDRLETVEIGRQGQIGGGAAVLAFIGGQRFVQLAARKRQRAAGLFGGNRFGMAAQVGADRFRLVFAKLCRQHGGRGADQAVHIEAGAQLGVFLPQAFACVGVGESQGAGIEGHRPAVFRRQFGEAAHAGAVKPLLDHLKQRENAALAGAGRVGECDRRRVEARRVRAIGVAGDAMTRGALLRVNLFAARKVGRRAGGQRHRIGLDQIGGDGARRNGDGIGRLLAGDQLFQRHGFLLQILARAGGGKLGDAFAGRLGELDHLDIFGVVDDLPIPHGFAIIDRDVIQQAPDGLRRRGLGVGGPAPKRRGPQQHNGKQQNGAGQHHRPLEGFLRTVRIM